MDIKKAALALAMIAGAGALGYRQYRSAAGPDPTTGKGTPLTMTYKGTVGGAFEAITARSGVKYAVAPDVASRPVEFAVSGKTVVQTQAVIQSAANVRYRPPTPGTDAVQVSSK